MKWTALILIGIIFLFTQVSSGDNSWKVEKSAHYIVYHQGAPSAYINELIRKAEGYYKSIADYLGFKRFNFWTWDNRCTIYLYPSQEAYLEDSGCISWSRAHVNVIKKEIKTFVNQDKFFDTILPHELGHIIFRELIGFEKKMPLWLDEGVACMQESDSQERLAAAKNMVVLNIYIPLNDLDKINDPKLIIPLIFYSQSASTIDCLSKGFGRNKFVNFCRRLRDGEDLLEALENTYKIKSLDELEKLWVEYLTELELPKQ